MFFPVSGIETSFWVPPLFAFAAAFVCSMGGISGAFLLLPFQVSVLGYTAPSVSATNQVFNLAAIPGGVYRYIREKRMVWPLTWVIVLGTVPGVFIGAWIRIFFLPDPGLFKLFVGCVLFYIALRLIKDTWFTRREPGAGSDHDDRRSAQSMSGISDSSFSLERIRYTYAGKEHTCSSPRIFLLCLVIGAVGSIYGIGGGSMVAPFLVAGFGLPIYTVAGAVLMGTFITSLSSVLIFHVLAYFHTHLQVAPDWALGLCFGVGGIAGMYLGARCQKFIPSTAIKTVLCLSMLFIAIRYVADFLWE